MRRIIWLYLIGFCLLTAGGCAPKITVFGDGGGNPLREYTLEGEGAEKIAVIPVRGVIGTDSRGSLLSSKPSVVQEVLSRLRIAEKDDQVRGVVLTVDSPGGSVVASEILASEVSDFRERTEKPVVAAMLSVAASGGYYVSAVCDRIVAHPGTLTGSVGTIFIRAEVSGLMNMVGVRAEVAKSGRLKDIGSPFRAATDEERRVFQDIIDSMNRRFLATVKKGRKMDDDAIAAISDARIYGAEQALQVGLVDEIGMLGRAFDLAREMAGLDENARIVTYRDRPVPDDTPYNTATAGAAAGGLFMPELARYLAVPRTGFYYLWAPEYAR